MSINIRTKGQTGEREVADDLNGVVYLVHSELGLPFPAKPVVQRNQNQSAVGGCDLTGTFGLAIEVKRQETLSINTWWAQCWNSAQERQEVPVLLFRQNAAPGKRTKWRCIMEAEVATAKASVNFVTRMEMDYDDFKKYFKLRVRQHLLAEYPHLIPQAA